MNYEDKQLVVTFVVPGRPVGKQRPRKGKYGRFYTPKKTQNYEEYIALKYMSEYQKMIVFGKDEKVYMGLMIYFEDNRRPDPNNVARLVADALEGYIYHNDKTVCQTFDYGFDKENPRIEIKVYKDKDEEDE